MINFGYPYNDIVICKDSTDYLWCVTCLTAVMFNRRGRGGLYRGTTSKRRVECVGEG